MSLVFYVSFAFYFVKMQLCVAKKRLCSGFYTSTPAVHQYTKSYTIFANDMAIYGDLRLLPPLEKDLKIREKASYGE